MDEQYPAPSAACEHWKIARRLAPTPGESCPSDRRYTVKDFIPHVTLCSKHYAEYESGRNGTLVKLWYQR